MRSKPLRLTFLYPAIGLVLTLPLSAILGLVIGSSKAIGKVPDTMTLSFLGVSLISLIGDQEILNHLPRFICANPMDASAKAAIKDGKTINLVITAILQLVTGMMMLMLVS